MKRWTFDTWAAWLLALGTAVLLGTVGDQPWYVAVGVFMWFGFGYMVGHDQGKPIAPREGTKLT